MDLQNEYHTVLYIHVLTVKQEQVRQLLTMPLFLNTIPLQQRPAIHCTLVLKTQTLSLNSIHLYSSITCFHLKNFKNQWIKCCISQQYKLSIGLLKYLLDISEYLELCDSYKIKITNGKKKLYYLLKQILNLF